MSVTIDGCSRRVIEDNRGYLFQWQSPDTGKWFNVTGDVQTYTQAKQSFDDWSRYIIGEDLV